jgi:hypothetical protein
VVSVLDWIVDKVDTLALRLLPPSLLGALFGDAFRNDLLTPRQRLAAFPNVQLSTFVNVFIEL